MKSNWKPVLSAVVVAVLAVNAAAFGGSLSTKSFICYFPGVDDCGCLDWELGNDLCVKAAINTKTCSVALAARGVVTNETCARQCYKNQVEPSCCIAEYICLKCSTYTVDKKGCAAYLAEGKIVKPAT